MNYAWKWFLSRHGKSPLGHLLVLFTCTTVRVKLIAAYHFELSKKNCEHFKNI